MPRAGLTTSRVVASGAELADETGLESVTLASLAARLGVRPPALYRHVEGIDDLRRRIATLAMTEVGDVLDQALRGRSRADAIAALFEGLRGYITDHPGRYAATTGAPLGGRDDELVVAAHRVMNSVRAALSGYGLPANELDDAIRMLRCLIHGYAMLASADGFQWDNDPAQSTAWMIRFVDAGLCAAGGPADDQTSAS